MTKTIIVLILLLAIVSNKFLHRQKYQQKARTSSTHKHRTKKHSRSSYSSSAQVQQKTEQQSKKAEAQNKIESAALNVSDPPSDKQKPKTQKDLRQEQVDKQQQRLTKIYEDMTNKQQSGPTEKKGAPKVFAKDMHSIPEIQSTFVNGSRPLPSNDQKVPDDWSDANYVKQISTYSRQFLKDINDPNKKDESYLVGKYSIQML